MASHLPGEPSWWAAGLLPGSPGWQRASSVRFDVLSSGHPSQADLGSSGRSMAIAGAPCPQPFLCPGLLRVPAGACKCREKAAGLLGSNLSQSPRLSKAGARLFTKLNSRGARPGKLGCWLGSAPSSSGFQTPACLSQVVRSGVVSLLLLKQKAEFLLISMGEPFISREQHLLLHPTAASPSRGEVRALRCSITGVSMATDPVVTRVGNSDRDSDFIVPPKLGRAGTRWGDLPKPRLLTMPMSQGRQPQPLGISARRGSPAALQTSRGFSCLQSCPHSSAAACLIDNLPCGGKLNIFALRKAVGVVCLAKGSRLPRCLPAPGEQSRSLRPLQHGGAALCRSPARRQGHAAACCCA